MVDLNIWLRDTFGEWTETLSGLFLILTAVLALILIIMIIVVAVRHSKNKKKIAALTAKANAAPDEEQLRKQIREEVEAEYKKNAERQEPAPAPAAAASTDDGSAAKIAELDETVKNQQARINELKAQLEAAQKEQTPDKNANAGLYRTINELNKRVKAQDEEIARLKSEAESEKPAEQKAEKPEPKKRAKPEPEPEPEEQDDEDDYYDDEYGDETSAVKVTLKFDRAKSNWVILRSDSERAYRRVATKQEALIIAKDLARRLHAQLAVHKKDGKFQRV